MKELYQHIARLSRDFEEYAKNASSAVALICMFEGKVPDGANHKNFMQAWEQRLC